MNVVRGARMECTEPTGSTNHRLAMSPHSGVWCFPPQVPGLAENRPSVLKGDVLYVRLLTHDSIPEAREYRGYVHEVQLEHVYLGFSDG